MTYLKRINTTLVTDFSKAVFDHVRNYLMCSLLLAIGIVALKNKTGLFFGEVAFQYPGVGIIILSCFLFCLNLFDGIIIISKYKYRRSLSVVLIILYIIASVRVVELALGLRVN